MITVSSAPGLGSVMVTFASEIWNSVGHVRSDNAMSRHVVTNRNCTNIEHNQNICYIHSLPTKL